MIYLRLMNKLAVFLVFVSVFGCDRGHTDYEWKYTTTVRFINETHHTIHANGIGCEISDIPANDIVTVELITSHYGVKESDKPNLDNIEPIFYCAFLYGDTGKCEAGVNEIENHENRKQIGDFEFEYTFRFTEGRLQNAQECQ